ncbi:TIM barrel protein [Nocardioides sp. YIM 152315]|uniref:TIM barrel protein n=1 Tax=Nocardioides sp. YIM 152315 TaxID=3031760 RepID=UPI0023DC8B33|nr:TIM barrel protein [Nocardioides sp. YIM 152315]MDF1605474.1 TIM barrel protein [Nocardioides sp. YIM 152315]
MSTAEKNGRAARVAGAPISWGVCEVPGWGWQLDPEVVLAQMAELGLAATEFGPDGFLPAEAQDRARLLDAHGLRAVGGFLPLVLHDPSHDPIPEADRYVDDCLAAGADAIVLAASTGLDGYDDRPELDDDGWACLLANLDAVDRLAAARGITASLHPHVGTMVERADEVARVLARSQIGLCLDTGHLLVGGSDPVALARDHADRIVHAHLKDVRLGLAELVRGGDLTYAEAVRRGLYTPLGDGDVDIPGIVGALEAVGYQGWYVLEQDVMLDEAPEDRADPIDDVRRSLAHLVSVLGAA